MFREMLIIVGSTLFFVAAALVCELLAPHERRSARFTGLSIALISALCGAGVVGVLNARVSVPTLLIVPALGLLSIPFALLLYDFAAYWLHRAQHCWFWRFHAVHHAPRELHGHVGALAHPVETACRFMLMSIPLSLADMRLIVIPATLSIARRFLEFYIHSETSADLGPLRRIVVDNRFHRLHHGRDQQYVDCNFGILFSFWDDLFGTAKWPAKDEWPDVGLDDYLPARTVKQYLFHPWSFTKSTSDSRDATGSTLP